MTRGYRATTIAEIARDAGVHVDTLSALVGRKPEILRELIELAISGADRPLAPEERDYLQRMQAEPDPGRQLEIYAGAVAAIGARMAPLFLALRDAAFAWATAGSELYALLADERGWTLDHYTDWLADAWRRLLLERDPGR